MDGTTSFPKITIVGKPRKPTVGCTCWKATPGAYAKIYKVERIRGGTASKWKGHLDDCTESKGFSSPGDAIGLGPGSGRTISDWWYLVVSYCHISFSILIFALTHGLTLCDTNE